jgi:hypothetical protein
MDARGSKAALTYIRWHFAIGSALLLFLSLVAFGDNLVTDVGQPSNADLKMVVHGLFLLAWVSVLAAQSSLPALGKMAWHRQLGTFGFYIAAGVALSTLWLFLAVWRGWDALRPEVLANRVFLGFYVVWMIGPGKPVRVRIGISGSSILARCSCWNPCLGAHMIRWSHHFCRSTLRAKMSTCS